MRRLPPSPPEQERLFVRLFEISPYEEPFSLTQSTVPNLCRYGPFDTPSVFRSVGRFTSPESEVSQLVSCWAQAVYRQASAEVARNAPMSYQPQGDRAWSEPF